MCSRFLNPVVNRGEDSMNIDGGASIELVVKFCYLGDVGG